MDGEKTGLDKETKAEILWSLDYVAKSIKTFGEEPTFDREFYANHLRKALLMLEGDPKK